MKISRYIVIGTVFYSVVFLLDYLITLFAIDKSGVYKSKLGLKITMDISPEELFTTFSLTPQIAITYGMWILILCVISFVVYKIRNRKNSE